MRPLQFRIGRCPFFLLLPVLLTGSRGALAHAVATSRHAATHVRSAPGVLAFSGGESKIVLDSPYASRRILVEERTNGIARDVTDQVMFSIAAPNLAAITEGSLLGLHDGDTVLTARLGNRSLHIPVVVRGVTHAAVPRFATDVLPVLTRAGCNMGACHGAAAGKGGFKLSLQGYDPPADFEAITRGASARRVAPAQPRNSLILRKPTFTVAHRGGKLFDVGSPQYRTIEAWIAGGMPAPQATDPALTRLEVVPPVRTLTVGQTQRFVVWATLSDGTRRDVSRETLFSGSDGSVITVSPSGEAKVVGNGGAAVLIRYRDLVGTGSVISPFGTPGKLSDTHPAVGPERIDQIVGQKLAELGLDASEKSADYDFLRRAYLDAIGTLPAPTETRAFLADKDPDKRTKLIDALLERPEYVDFWTLKWGDILRSSRAALNPKGMMALNQWIRRSVAENKPWNQFARDLILANGSMYEDGAANYFRAASTPETLAEMTSQVFLGVRLQCARCHNHPYEKWKQTQYYQMAAFFARVRTKEGENPDERVVFAGNSGEELHLKTHEVMIPTALDAAPIPATFTGDRRQALADWLTGPKNPFFAHILVNRVWKHFMGQGLVEPVDDLRATNPPSNAVLFDWLAQDFVAHGYDVKYLIRNVMRSQTYQRSAIPTKSNAADNRYYSHFLFKRLEAEPLLDALGSATGVPEKFAGYPVGMRADQLPDTTPQSYFLDLFGRPARNIVCACERTDAPNLAQLLHFMNGKAINDQLSAKNGRIAGLIAAKVPDASLVEDLYLAAFSRYPTPEDTKQAVHALTAGKDRQKAAEDVLWALVNSKEFLFNH